MAYLSHQMAKLPFSLERSPICLATSLLRFSPVPLPVLLYGHGVGVDLPPNPDVLSSISLTLCDMEEALRCIKPSCSAGLDGIPPILLKMIQPYVLPSLLPPQSSELPYPPPLHLGKLGRFSS